MEPQEQTNKNPAQITDVVTALKDANNILVTISKDPTVDQLSACIGLALALNKAGKHATAVFSGQIPSMIEFLDPEKTLEPNTDSLRDFIISLDKSKADKLRYKVEDNVVRIFITPYRTSISEKDLDFSQGDFNIDAVVALGVLARADLDQAIVAHGRILHDAKIISIGKQASELGNVEWLNASASSISEMIADLIVSYDEKLLDTQSSTSLLTGIVYETDRFKNDKSSPHTMSTSGILMASGASTQLVAEKLEEGEASLVSEKSIEPNTPQDSQLPEVDSSNETLQPENSDNIPGDEAKADGSIEIEHQGDQIVIDDEGRLNKIEEILAREKALREEQEKQDLDKQTHSDTSQDSNLPTQPTSSVPVQPEPITDHPSDLVPQPSFDTQPQSVPNSQSQDIASEDKSIDQTSDPELGSTNNQSDFKPQGMVFEPPTFGGQLTANSINADNQYSSVPDPTLSFPDPVTNKPTLTHSPNQTLSELEESVNSPHINQYAVSDMANSTKSDSGTFSSPTPEPAQPYQSYENLNQPSSNTDDGLPSEEYAKAAVERAIAGATDYKPEPIMALGAQPAINVDHGMSAEPSGPPPPPVPPPMQ